MVITTLFSNTISQFLESDKHYDNSPYWSGACASRLRESIPESDILSFLATEWMTRTIMPECGSELRSTCCQNIKTACIMTNWSSLLPTEYENRDSFLTFYYKTKGILHTLTKSNSIAATGNVFLKANFSTTIEAKEL